MSERAALIRADPMQTPILRAEVDEDLVRSGVACRRRPCGHRLLRGRQHQLVVNTDHLDVVSSTRVVLEADDGPLHIVLSNDPPRFLTPHRPATPTFALAELPVGACVLSWPVLAEAAAPAVRALKAHAEQEQAGLAARIPGSGVCPAIGVMINEALPKRLADSSRCIKVAQRNLESKEALVLFKELWRAYPRAERLEVDKVEDSHAPLTLGLLRRLALRHDALARGNDASVYS
eukprot:611437-Prymnesium_polylepis.2